MSKFTFVWCCLRAPQNREKLSQSSLYNIINANKLEYVLMKLGNWCIEIKSSENKVIFVIFWLNELIFFNAIVYPPIRYRPEQIFFSLKFFNYKLIVRGIFQGQIYKWTSIYFWKKTSWIISNFPLNVLLFFLFLCLV